MKAKLGGGLAGTHFLSYNFTIVFLGLCCLLRVFDCCRALWRGRLRPLASSAAREKQTQRSTEIQRDRDVDERKRERKRNYRENRFGSEKRR